MHFITPTILNQLNDQNHIDLPDLKELYLLEMKSNK